MSAQEIVFTVLAVFGSVAAIRVVTSRNVVRAALYLVGTLATVAGVYLLVGAEFLAWVQVLIYVGAVVVLLLFSLMLTRAPIGRETLDNQQRPLAVLVGALVLAGLTLLLWEGFGDEPAARLQTVRTADVGISLFQDWVLPFEVVSVLLLAALIGAVVLARRDEAPEVPGARQVSPITGRRVGVP